MRADPRTPTADEDDGVYHAAVTVTWAVEWTATGGWGGGSLPDATRTTTFDLTVTELQAVVCHGSLDDCPEP